MGNWNNRSILYLIGMMFFFMTSCEKDDVEPEKMRTLMVYLDGGSNLVSVMKTNISDMASTWKKEYNANIVIYFGYTGGIAKLITFDIAKDGTVEQKEIKIYEESNMSPAENMRLVLKDMQALYPCSSYGLIVGSHGTGWMPQAMTPRTNREPGKMINGNPLTRTFGAMNEMDTRDMAKAIPDGMEFILFDACLMASIETLYDLRNKAKYLIVSAAEVPGSGFPYKKCMPYFWKEGEALEKDLILLCDAYVENYTIPDGFGTIALVRAAKLDDLYSLTRRVLHGQAGKAAQIGASAVYYYPRVNYSSHYVFFDLADYIRYMTQEMPGVYSECHVLMNQVVVYKACTNPFYGQHIPLEKFSGITTYIPRAVWPELNKSYFTFPWASVYQ